MKNSLSIALLVAGLLLLVWGVSSWNSVSSELSDLFTGAPTRKAIVLLVLGLVLGIVGMRGMRQE